VTPGGRTAVAGAVMPSEGKPATPDAAGAAARPSTSRSRPAVRAAYTIVLTVCGVIAIGRVLLGGFVFVAARFPGMHEALGPAYGLISRAAATELTRQTLFEFGFSLLDLGLGVAILVSCGRDRHTRLLGLAMIAVGGTCSLWTQAAATAVKETLSVSRAATGDVLLQSVAIAAFVLALLAYPMAGDRRSGPGRGEFLIAGGSAVVLGGVAAIALPAALSYVVLFGMALPAVGLLLLRHRGGDDLTADERTQLRLLFSVLVGLAAIGVTLVLVTVLVSMSGWHGLILADPTTRPAGSGLIRETALLFWFCRLVPIAIAVSTLAASRREQLDVNQHRFSLGLVFALVATLVGGLFVVIYTAIDKLAEGTGLDESRADPLAAFAAALPAALLLQPAYVRAERWVDRLLYGRRPAPYNALAGITFVSRATGTQAPDLTRVAEAVGRGLGARVCRLTVHRPGLADRVYTWSEATVAAADAPLTIPIVRGDEELGSITVDRDTAAGLDVHRQRLIEDIADSLGAVLEAHRLGIELERQLRAVRAHAADIAASRRRLVAEMDAERRRIERDLHDGAQHHLVSLRLSLGLVEHQLRIGQIEQAKASLDRIARQIDEAESIMARTATGVTSPLLAQHGLVVALTTELAGGHPAVAIATSGVDAESRFPAAIESAVWYCCLEAVGNARKHAPEAQIRLTLRSGEQRLEFSVQDDGPGCDMAANGDSPGRGMRNVASRVTAAGGRLSVQSEPGAGTRVDGWLPLPAEPAGPSSGQCPPGSGVGDDQEEVLAGAPSVSSVSGTFAGSVRDALQNALTRYGEASTAEKVRQLRTDLDRSVLPATPAAAPAAPVRRSTVLAAWSALRELEALIHSEPPHTGADALLRQLERIRSGTHDLAEVDAIDALRSGTCELGPDDIEKAARLLGESGSDARSRLGLEPDADDSLVVAAAGQAVMLWRARASHPATAPNARMLAATVVQSCEHLLHGR
jgi:signal transduction histidine kinase